MHRAENGAFQWNFSKKGVSHGSLSLTIELVLGVLAELETKEREEPKKLKFVIRKQLHVSLYIYVHKMKI